MIAHPPFGLADPAYEDWVRGELSKWRTAVLAPPSPFARAAKGVQGRINRLIPEEAHAAITRVIEGMTRAILTGADLTTGAPVAGLSLAERDRRALETVDGWRKTAAVEGGVAGAGGLWLALADFPALLTIKFKLLFDLSAIYGHDASVLAERLFILKLVHLTFSDAQRRAAAYAEVETWDAQVQITDLEGFDWRGFQQAYRDDIDLAKLAQLIPVVGAPIGAAVNWRLLERLGETAINAYRLRWLGG